MASRVFRFIALLSLGFVFHVSAADKQNGDALRRKGNALADKGKFKEAYAYFESACTQSDAKGCFNLALADIRGEGTQPSCYNGYRHFTKSCELGFQTACDAMKKVPEPCHQPVENSEMTLKALCVLAGEGDCEQTSDEDTSSESAEAEASEEEDDTESVEGRSRSAAVYAPPQKTAAERRLEQQREDAKLQQDLDERYDRRVANDAALMRDYDRRRQAEADMQREYDRKRQQEEDARREYDRKRQQEEDARREYDRQRAMQNR